jgi:hypothetical protein
MAFLATGDCDTSDLNKYTANIKQMYNKYTTNIHCRRVIWPF